MNSIMVSFFLKEHEALEIIDQVMSKEVNVGHMTMEQLLILNQFWQVTKTVPNYDTIATWSLMEIYLDVDGSGYINCDWIPD